MKEMLGVLGVLLLLVAVPVHSTRLPKQASDCSKYKTVPNVIVIGHPDSAAFRTRLVQAVKAEDISCVQEFIDAGDSLQTSDEYGFSPVGYAAVTGNTKIMEILYKNGVNIDDFQGPTGENGTALHVAMCYGQEDIVEFLADIGVNPVVGTKNACTCLPPGSKCNKDRMVELLRKPALHTFFQRDYPNPRTILNDGKKDITASNRECWELCAKNEACQYWVRIKKDQENGSREGECWLRSFGGSWERCPTCDSGYAHCFVGEGEDMPTDTGLLNDGRTTITVSNKECCALCKARADCRSWTRIKYDAEGHKEGECWLRDNIPESAPCAYCDSATDKERRPIIVRGE